MNAMPHMGPKSVNILVEVCVALAALPPGVKNDANELDLTSKSPPHSVGGAPCGGANI